MPRMERADLEDLREKFGTFREAARQAPPELAFTTDSFADDPQQRSALAACHAVLATKQVTVAELRRKLLGARFDDVVVEHAIERCTAAGLLDDERYAASFVESRVRRGHGAQRIRQDLARRGVDRALVEQALAEQQDAGALEAAALEAARRRFARADLDDASARAKALRWLRSRGYSGAESDAAIAALRVERADAES